MNALRSTRNTPLIYVVWKRLAIANVVVTVLLLVASVVSEGSRVDELTSSVSLGQLAIFAVWLTFGGGYFAPRLVTYLVLGTLVTAIGLNLPRNGTQVIPVASWQAVVMMFAVSLPLSISWVRGWRLVHGSSLDRDGRPWQVSTKLLFALTLLVALLITLNRLVTSMGVAHEGGRIAFPSSGYGVISGIVVFGVTFLGLVASVGSAIWACLSTYGYRSHLAATLVIVALLVGFPMHVRIASSAHFQWAVMMGTTMSTIVVSLLVLRGLGVRAVRVPTPSIR